MRLLVARCEVSYSGRLSAYLLVHADAGGYKPLTLRLWPSGPDLPPVLGFPVGYAFGLNPLAEGRSRWPR